MGHYVETCLRATCFGLETRLNLRCRLFWGTLFLIDNTFWKPQWFVTVLVNRTLPRLINKFDQLAFCGKMGRENDVSISLFIEIRFPPDYESKSQFLLIRVCVINTGPDVDTKWKSSASNNGLSELLFANSQVHLLEITADVLSMYTCHDS